MESYLIVCVTNADQQRSCRIALLQIPQVWHHKVCLNMFEQVREWPQRTWDTFELFMGKVIGKLIPYGINKTISVVHWWAKRQFENAPCIGGKVLFFTSCVAARDSVGTYTHIYITDANVKNCPTLQKEVIKTIRLKAMSIILTLRDLGPDSISDKISQSLSAARFVLRLAWSLWNLTGTLVALLPMCLSNVKALRTFLTGSPLLRVLAKARTNAKIRSLRINFIEIITEIYKLWKNERWFL